LEQLKLPFSSKKKRITTVIQHP
jgi:Ca2+-transporting ATPase